MKKVTAIIRPEKLEELKDALNEKGIHGMTVYEVMGCGSQHGWTEYYRGKEVMLNMIPKVKVELVVNNAQVEDLIGLVCDVEVLVEDEDATTLTGVLVNAAQTGKIGDGKVWVSDVSRVVRIRTGERGVKAV